jgi:mRNA interferase MazF
MQLRRGDIFYAQLNPVIGSEQGGMRPVLVIQNDIGNQYSPTTIIIAITSQIVKAKLPTHVEISAKKCGMEKDSVILTEQIRTIDKSRLKQKVANLDDDTMGKVNKAIQVSLGLIDI